MRALCRRPLPLMMSSSARARKECKLNHLGLGSRISDVGVGRSANASCTHVHVEGALDLKLVGEESMTQK